MKRIIFVLLLLLAALAQGQVAPFSLPVPLGPGESAIALLTTNGVKLTTSGGGSLTVGSDTGTIVRHGSSSLGDSVQPGFLFWNTLATLPFAQSQVTKIYAVGLINLNGIFGIKYLDYSKQGGVISDWPFGEIDGELYSDSIAFSGQVSFLAATGAPAQSLNLNNIKFRLRNESSINYLGPPDDSAAVTALGLVVYYIPGPASTSVRHHAEIHRADRELKNVGFEPGVPTPEPTPAPSTSPSLSTRVTVSSPVNGSSVVNPVTFKATGSSANGISGWVIYMDGQNIYQINNNSNSLTATLALPIGQHSIYIRAWDKRNGSFGTSPVFGITVAAVPPPTTVAVSAPADGATVVSPVTFTATGTSPHGISGWVIYVDGQNAYQVDNNSNSLNATVSLALGPHDVYIRAWDKTSGYGTSSTFSITVIANNGLPTPPVGAIVFEDIDDTNNWSSCSDCAGGQKTTSSFPTVNGQASPSLDGASREFSITGGPWTAALWWHFVNTSPGQYDSKSHFLWDFYVYVDSLANVHNLEFDAFQVPADGYEYMMGTHCSYGSGFWYGWNQVTFQWIKTAVPCNANLMPAGKWNHIQFMLERLPGTHNYRYDTLVVNDVSYTLNLTEPAAPINWSHLVGVQWQIDTNGNVGTTHMWTDRAKLTIW